MSKFYTVANGRQIGIFSSWQETEPLVKGYPGAKYKSFSTFTEAQNYLTANQISTIQISTNPKEKTPRPKIPLSVPLANHLIVYTDGSCVNRIGGIGYIIIQSNQAIPFAGKVPTIPTTNQVAELYAIYSAIYYVSQHHSVELKDHGLMIFTDSQYSISCLTEWYHNWIKNGWINSKGEPVVNQELIRSILNLSEGKNIKYQHVKAHVGNYYNEWADRLANEGRLYP